MNSRCPLHYKCGRLTTVTCDRCVVTALKHMAAAARKLSNRKRTDTASVTGRHSRLIWPAQPSVLPGKRDGLKGSSDPGEFAVTVAKLYRLMLRKRDRDRPTYTRIRLKRPDLKDVIDGGLTAVPVVAIDRGPQPRLHVVTQMHFDRADGGLSQSILARGELAARQVVAVCGE